MKQVLTVSKIVKNSINCIVAASLLSSLSLMGHVALAQDANALNTLKPHPTSITANLTELQNETYQKMAQIDNPNAVDLADLHSVIFSKNEATLHSFLVHANYDKMVNSQEYKNSQPNAQDLADTMGSLNRLSTETLIESL